MRTSFDIICVISSSFNLTSILHYFNFTLLKFLWGGLEVELLRPCTVEKSFKENTREALSALRAQRGKILIMCELLVDIFLRHSEKIT